MAKNYKGRISQVEYHVDISLYFDGTSSREFASKKSLCKLYFVFIEL